MNRALAFEARTDIDCGDRWVPALPSLRSAGEMEAAATRTGGMERHRHERLLKAESEPSQWMTYNGTYSEQRYSRLTGITKDNVKLLGLVWFADYDTESSPPSGTPLYIDGVIYVTTAWRKCLRVRREDRQAALAVQPEDAG